MSYTIVDDGPVIQVRASIQEPGELKELIETLSRRLADLVPKPEPQKETK